MIALHRHLPRLLALLFAAVGCMSPPCDEQCVAAVGSTGTETAGEVDPLPLADPVFELSLSQVKQFDFAWMPVIGTDYYQLLESAEGLHEQIMFSEDSMRGPVSVFVLDNDPKEGNVFVARWDFTIDP